MGRSLQCSIQTCCMTCWQLPIFFVFINATIKVCHLPDPLEGIGDPWDCRCQNLEQKKKCWRNSAGQALSMEGYGQCFRSNLSSDSPPHFVFCLMRINWLPLFLHWLHFKSVCAVRHFELRDWKKKGLFPLASYLHQFLCRGQNEAQLWCKQLHFLTTARGWKFNNGDQNIAQAIEHRSRCKWCNLMQMTCLNLCAPNVLFKLSSQQIPPFLSPSQ